MAKKMVKDLDSNADGSIDKSEFVAGLKSKGVSQADAEKLFSSIDTKGTGKITQADIETSMKKMGGKGAPAGGPPPSGMPSGGGAPSGGTQKSGGTSGSSSSDNKVYDKKDKNKDGTVSYQEEMEYDISHPEERAKSQASSTAKTENGNYNQKGNAGEEGGGTNGSVNVSA
jgi:Ca2+-binding EF-hand superfamily protein